MSSALHRVIALRPGSSPTLASPSRGWRWRKRTPTGRDGGRKGPGLHQDLCLCYFTSSSQPVSSPLHTGRDGLREGEESGLQCSSTGGLISNPVSGSKAMPFPLPQADPSPRPWIADGFSLNPDRFCLRGFGARNWIPDQLSWLCSWGSLEAEFPHSCCWPALGRGI